MKDTKKQYSLMQAIANINNAQDLELVFKDLCTPQEILALEERWVICQLLDDGLSYRDIHTRCGASLTTITRVARFLKLENNKGYTLLLKEKKKRGK